MSAVGTGVEITKRSLSLVEMIAVATLGAVFGFWWDRPGLVRPKSAENPLETRAQVASAIFWPTLAVWLAVGVPRCPEWLGALASWASRDVLSPSQWAVLVTVFAALVLMRRMLASNTEKWPLRYLVRQYRMWVTRHPLLLGALVTACGMVPLYLAMTGSGGVIIHAVPALVFLTVGVAVAHLEVRWRRRCRRMMPDLIQIHGLTMRTSDMVLETGALRPGKGRDFVLAPVPAEAVAHLDALEERVARHLPAYEPQVRRNDAGAVAAIRYVAVGEETATQRDVLARTGGFLTAITPVEIPRPARPGECVGHLAADITETRAEELDATLRASDGLSLVEWRKGERTVHLAALDAATLTERDRIATKVACKPWDLDLVVLVEDTFKERPEFIMGGRGPKPEPALSHEVTGWHLTRFPAGRDPEKRRETWLTMARDLHPPTDARTWTIIDHSAADELELRLIVDPLDRIVSFDEDVTQLITPDTPWRVGIDEEGQPIEINLAQNAHLLIAGATRSGKSVCTYSLISHVLRMGDSAKLLVADPNDTTIAPFEDKVAWSTSDTHPDAVTDMLEWVRGEMDRRKPILRDMRADKISQFTPDLPMIVVVIDEAANYMRHNDKQAAAAMIGELLAVVSQGAKYGVRLVLITQRPDGEILKTSIRAQLSARISFRVEDGETAKMVFPDLPDPLALLTCAPGVGFVREVGGQAKRFRSVYLDDHWGVADRLTYRQSKINVGGVGAPIATPPADAWGMTSAVTTPSVPDEVLVDEVVLTLDDLESETRSAPAVSDGLDDFEFGPVTVAAPPVVRRRPTAQSIPDDLWT